MKPITPEMKFEMRLNNLRVAREFKAAKEGKPIEKVEAPPPKPEPPVDPEILALRATRARLRAEQQIEMDKAVHEKQLRSLKRRTPLQKYVDDEVLKIRQKRLVARQLEKSRLLERLALLEGRKIDFFDT
jgi:hypothetical protein